MKPHRSRLALVITLALLALAAQALSARVKVKVDFEPAFDFKKVRTWGWRSPTPGDVLMARTYQDDAEAMRKRAEPVILDAVPYEMKRRGLAQADTAPDLMLTYYLLLSTSMSTQELGQFAQLSKWGLPPFTGATQSLEFFLRGSLVLDLSAAGSVVWRGVAQAEIKPDAEERKRIAILREAVRDLLAKFPPRK
jgi:hypothetical protein